jgi:hypothetical protein
MIQITPARIISAIQFSLGYLTQHYTCILFSSFLSVYNNLQGQEAEWSDNTSTSSANSYHLQDLGVEDMTALFCIIGAILEVYTMYKRKIACMYVTHNLTMWITYENSFMLAAAWRSLASSLPPFSEAWTLFFSRSDKYFSNIWHETNTEIRNRKHIQ